MRYDTFIKAVQKHCRLSSLEQAVAAIRATLMTLAERLSVEECEDLAAQLSPEIAFYLRQGEQHVQRKLKYKEFIQLVADRGSMTFPEALFRARGVMTVLSTCVSSGEMNDVRAQLPRDFAPLFQPVEVTAS